MTATAPTTADWIARADAVELRMPVEMPSGVGGQTPSAYKGRMLLRLTPDDTAAVLRMVASASPNDPKTTQPPANFNPDRRPWRLVRFESDLKPVQGEAPLRGAPGG